MKKALIGFGIVIIIIGIVFTILYNTPERQGKREARKIKATAESLAEEQINTEEETKLAVIESIMKQAGLAMHMYAQDHNVQFPSSLRELCPEYMSEDFLQRVEEAMDYYGAGVSDSAPKDKVIGMSKTSSPSGEFFFLYVDGKVEKKKPYPGMFK